MTVLSPYKIPVGRFLKNGSYRPPAKTLIKWFETPHRTITLTRNGEYQNIKYTAFNPGSRNHIQKWLEDDTGYKFPYFTPKGGIKVDIDSLLTMEHPSGKLLARYLKVAKDQSQVGGGDGALLKYVNEKTSTVSSRVDTNGTLCLTSGTLFDTDLGVIALKDLKIGQLVLTSEGVYKPITDIINNGIKPILEVETNSGLKLKTTLNHPYLVNGEWIEASNLKVNMSLTTVPSAEIWKPIKGWEHYSISTWGRVSNNQGKILKPQKKSMDRSGVVYGHLKITLRKFKGTRAKGTIKDFAIHRLVATTFLEGTGEVRHLNGIPYYNHVENLKFGSSKENSSDTIKFGTSSKRGCTQAKITEKIAELIRSTTRNAVSDLQFALQFNVSRELVRDIRLGKRWVPTVVPTKKTVKLVFDKIKSIKVLEEQQTYGVTVADEHTHITNGIATHNTGRFTSSSINLNQIPSQKEFRELFSAPTYYLLTNELFNELKEFYE